MSTCMMSAAAVQCWICALFSCQISVKDLAYRATTSFPCHGQICCGDESSSPMTLPVFGRPDVEMPMMLSVKIPWRGDPPPCSSWIQPARSAIVQRLRPDLEVFCVSQPNSHTLFEVFVSSWSFLLLIFFFWFCESGRYATALHWSFSDFQPLPKPSR